MKPNRLLITLVLSMFISTGAFASNQNISITIDGVKLHTDVAPTAINNRTMIPMRAIFEAMGADVAWDNATSTATGTKGNDEVKLQLGNLNAYINGKQFRLDVPAIAINGRILVPVRFVSESLGANVGWDGKTQTVVIKKNTEAIVKPEVSKDHNNRSIETEVLKLVNIERNSIGLSSLKASNELSNVARMKSQDMADSNYFSHTSPTYGSPFDMMKRFGIRYNAAGENIAKGYPSVEKVMEGWMNSPGHKKNILSPNFGTLGVGYVNIDGTTYWTQMFTN